MENEYLLKFRADFSDVELNAKRVLQFIAREEAQLRQRTQARGVDHLSYTGFGRELANLRSAGDQITRELSNRLSAQELRRVQAGLDRLERRVLSGEHPQFRSVSGAIPGPIRQATRERAASEAYLAQRDAARLRAETERTLAQRFVSGSGGDLFTRSVVSSRAFKLAQDTLVNQAFLTGRDKLLPLHAELARTSRELRQRENLTANRAFLEDSRRVSPIVGESRALAARRRAEENIFREFSLAGTDFTDVEATRRAMRALRESRTRQSQVGLQLGDDETTRQRARTLIAEKQLERATRDAARQLIATSAARGEELLGSGTRFQRLQAGIANRRGGGGQIRSPEDFQTFGQFFGSRFLTTAGYAASGALLYGGQRLIVQMVQDASELERIFGLIEAQFNSIGEGAGFDEFRDGILEIARESGVAAKDVAFLAFQLKGAFGDTPQALENIDAAARIVKVTGLELKEVTDSLTAASRSFGVAFEAIGDEAVAVEERFGVQAKETIKFLGDLAPVADAAGLSMKELAVIAGVAQQRSGRSGAALAEAFGRIIPSIQGVAVELVTLYRSVPALQARVGEIAGYAGRGETGSILKALIEDYDKLNTAQQQQVITLLGGRREAAALIPVLEAGASAFEDYARAGDVTGKTQERFARVQRTLTERLARFNEVLRQLAVTLFNAGIGDALKDLVAVGSVLVDVVRVLASVFEGVNSALGGVPLRLLEVAAAIKIATVALRAFAGANAVASVSGLLGGGGQAAAFRQLAVQYGAVGALSAAFPNARPGTPSRVPVAGAVGRSGFGQGASLALGGLLGGPVGISAVGALAVLAAVSNERGQVGREAESFREALRRAPTERLLEAREVARPSFLDRVGGFLFGRPDKEIDKELQRRANADGIERLRATRQVSADLGVGLSREQRDELFRSGRLPGSLPIQQAFLQSGLSEEFVGRLEKRANEGDKDAAAFIDFLNDTYGALEGVSTRVFQRLQEQKRSASLEETRSKVKSGELLTSVEEAKKQYESGEISAVDFLEVMEKTAESYRLIADNGGLGAPERAALAGLMKEKSNLISSLARQSLQFQLELAGLVTDDRTSTINEVEKLTALLANPDFTDLGERAKVATDLVKALRRRLEQDIEAAVTYEEAIRIAERGVEIPSAVRDALTRQTTVLDLPFQRVARAVGSLFGGGESFTNQVVSLAEETQRSIRQATIDAIDREIARQEAFLNRTDIGEGDFTGAQQAIERLREARRIAEGITDAAVPDALREAALARAARIRAAEAQFALERIQADGDPEKLAAIAVREAQLYRREATNAEQFAEAARKRAEADIAIKNAVRAREDSVLAVIAAQAEAGLVNPVDAARRQLEVARQRYASAARGSIEANNLLAERIRAELNLRNVIQAQFEAALAIPLALAEATQDALETARLRLQIAQNALTLARQAGVTGPALQQLEAQVILAADAVNDQILQDARDRVQFQLEIGEISRAQAVAQLEALLSIADDEKERRQLLLEIKRLKESVGDLQFNLPTELGTPVLYQARRLQQFGTSADIGLGAAATTVNVTFNNYNAQDYEGAISRTGDLFQRSAIFGTRTRSF